MGLPLRLCASFSQAIDDIGDSAAYSVPWEPVLETKYSVPRSVAGVSRHNGELEMERASQAHSTSGIHAPGADIVTVEHVIPTYVWPSLT